MNLVPYEIINKSSDAYLARHSVKSQWIYWIVLIAVTIVIVSLPFLYVDISVRDSGVIRPFGEKTTIISPLTEYVDCVYITEGNHIQRGDTLLTFRSSTSNSKIQYRHSRLHDLSEHINDLRYLANNMKPDYFHSDTRRQEYIYYTKQQLEYETIVEKTKKDFERNQILYEKHVISDEEFESSRYEYIRSTNQLASFRDNQLSTWQTDLNSALNVYNEMQFNLNLDLKEKDLYTVISPVNGTIDQFAGIYVGSNIHSGNIIAVISPDSVLYAEVFVSPRHIGYLTINMPVNMQVESFNYNEWGILSGNVFEISSDFFTSDDGIPFYKVKCRLEKDYLQHKKGMKGYIKKGMTLSAHFMITRR